MSAETVQTQTQADPASELDLPIWSVISFERVEATDLDHVSAATLLAELENKKVAGLCIVVNDAAARIKTPK
jgi:hypothetical protein